MLLNLVFLKDPRLLESSSVIRPNSIDLTLYIFYIYFIFKKIIINSLYDEQISELQLKTIKLLNRNKLI